MLAGTSPGSAITTVHVPCSSSFRRPTLNSGETGSSSEETSSNDGKLSGVTIRKLASTFLRDSHLYSLPVLWGIFDSSRADSTVRQLIDLSTTCFAHLGVTMQLSHCATHPQESHGLPSLACSSIVVLHGSSGPIIYVGDNLVYPQYKSM